MNNPTPTPGYLDRVEAHLRKAVEMHPHFADTVCSAIQAANAAYNLKRLRTDMRRDARTGGLAAAAILKEELLEIKQSYNQRDYAHAADECYDAIAVLLRMAFWLDQMAAEEKGETK